MTLRRASSVLLLLLTLATVGCSAIPLAPTTPPPPNTLVYDAPTSLTIRNGSVLPGTPVGYGGKTQTGAAKLLISGLVAAKQVGDSMDWQGSLVPNTVVKLNTRVISFDDQNVTLAGTAHVELTKVEVQPGISQGTAQWEFNAPVTYSLDKGNKIPGSNISFVGATDEGARFAGVEGYAFRKMLDSLQYVGRLNAKVALKLDLRILNFSNSNLVLGGTANLKIE